MWADNEFGGAPLGDARRGRRLVQVACLQSEQPRCAFSGVAKADWPTAKACYRLIDQPEETAVSMQSILAPHRQRTLRRMQGCQTVLCVQDGSTLDFTALDQCDGPGPTGTNQTGAKSQGLLLHSTLAVAPNGLPLEVLKSQCIAPPDDPATAPPEARKTFPWIEHHRDLVEVAAERLRRAIAIRLVIAWRIMLMTLLGRETPDLPAEVLFCDVELRTLTAFAHKKRRPEPKCLGDAVHLVAILGGHLDRNSDPPPGHQLLWHGYMQFQFMCLGFALLEDP